MDRIVIRIVRQDIELALRPAEVDADRRVLIGGRRVEFGDRRRIRDDPDEVIGDRQARGIGRCDRDVVDACLGRKRIDLAGDEAGAGVDREAGRQRVGGCPAAHPGPTAGRDDASTAGSADDVRIDEFARVSRVDAR